MARICSVCGKPADTLMSTGNTIGKSIVCTSCYKKIPSYSPRENFQSLNELNRKQKKVLQELEDNQFPQNVKDDYMAFYEKKKEDFVLYEDVIKMITSTPSFEGYRIKEYKGFVSGEVVLGTGFLSSMESGIADMFGMESSSYQDKIDVAQQNALLRALKEAQKVGGNAIVGAKMDLESFTGDLICILVTGTAVVIEKED